MKRVGNLFEQIITFENLMRSAYRAAQGKKTQPRVAHFLFHLEKEILQLQQELSQETWQPSGFRVFDIREPKPRRISAADFRDRVVHHALCNHLEPVFDKRLIYDTWACRKGKGTHQAVKRTQTFCQEYPYFLKCDIKRYFDNIDHQVLKKLLRRILKDKHLLSVLDRIIDYPLPGTLTGKGLPIGNLTSQYFANLYLGVLDHELKESLGVKAYIRYMDDMLIFAHSKRELHQLLAVIEAFIHKNLQLRLKPSATQIAPVTEGVAFLGFRIYPKLIRLQGKSLRRFRHRMRKNEQNYQEGGIIIEDLTASTQSMIAHMRQANTLRLRQSLLSSSMVQG